MGDMEGKSRSLDYGSYQVWCLGVCFGPQTLNLIGSRSLCGYPKPYLQPMELSNYL